MRAATAASEGHAQGRLWAVLDISGGIMQVECCNRSNGRREPRLPDRRIAAKVRFREVKTLVPVNTADTEPWPIGSSPQCDFPKADIALRRRDCLMLINYYPIGEQFIPGRQSRT